MSCHHHLLLCVFSAFCQPNASDLFRHMHLFCLVSVHITTDANWIEGGKGVTNSAISTHIKCKCRYHKWLQCQWFGSDKQPLLDRYEEVVGRKNAFRRYCRAKISFFLWLRAVYQLSCSRVTVCIFVFWSEKHKVCVVNFELWFFVALTRFTRRSHNSLFRCTSSIGVHLAWQ